MTFTTLQVQERLAMLGYQPGPIDDVLGPKTIEAIKQFQRVHGLAADGVAGPKTLSKLFPKAEPIITKSNVSAQKKATRPIREIVIHCTATPEGRDVSVETIRAWHLANGWSDVGYHFVVMRDGTVRPGRPEAKVGSHVAGHNVGTLGVVYVGGTDANGKPKDTRTPAQKAALLQLAKDLIEKYTTITKITGHNEHTKAKACPSFDVRKDPLGHLLD